MNIKPYNFTIPESVTTDVFEGYIGRKPINQEDLASFGIWVQDVTNDTINWDEIYLKAAELFKEMG